MTKWWKIEKYLGLKVHKNATYITRTQAVHGQQVVAMTKLKPNHLQRCLATSQYTQRCRDNQRQTNDDDDDEIAYFSVRRKY